MKKVLTFLLDLTYRVIGLNETFHDETLRANQGDRSPGFSFWRALVS